MGWMFGRLASSDARLSMRVMAGGNFRWTARTTGLYTGKLVVLARISHEPKAFGFP